MKRKNYTIIDESGPKKVGRFYKSIKKEYMYSLVKFDDDKWADASKFLPADYDLVWCQIENKDKALSGWHTGTCWDGLHIK